MSKNSTLYITVMEVIKEKIINGYYKIGDFIPTEIELEKEFGVSKITVRKAIELLEGEGYVTKRSGKGTTVISNSIFNKLSKGDSFSNILNQEGYTLRKEKTTFTQMNLLPQDELFNYFGENCLKVTRIYYLDGKPYIYFTHFLPENLALDKIEDENNFSIYMQLYRSGFHINNFHDEFYIDYPSIDILNELELEDGPTLGRRRVTYDADNNVIEVSLAHYNTRIHKYVINYKV